MIALDTNVLIAALVSDHPQHHQVSEWLSQQNSPLACSTINRAEVLRLLSHPRVFSASLRLEKAIRLLDDFLQAFEVFNLSEPDNWMKRLDKLCQDIPGLRGNDVFDARIAICCRSNGCGQIATYDSLFRRFHFLQIISP